MMQVLAVVIGFALAFGVLSGLVALEKRKS